MPDTEEWSSMFYEATIVNIENGGREGKVYLRFNGDSEVYDIDPTKLVKKPKRRAKVQKGQKRNISQTTKTVNTTDRQKRINPSNGQDEEGEAPTAKGSDNEHNDVTNGANINSVIDNENDSVGPPTKKQKLKAEKSEKKTNNRTNNRVNEQNSKSTASTNLSTYRYPDFCGVLGKKIKRMNAILNERNTDKV